MQQLSRRVAMRLTAGGLTSLALGGLSLDAVEAATSPAFDITPYLHPELRKMVPALVKTAGIVPNDKTIALHRKAMARFSLPPMSAPTWTERSVPGLAGSPDVPVFIINGKPGGPPRPVILYIHGGGFVMGTARMSLRGAQEVAAALNCVVVSVDYRLAPETRYVGSLADNYAALKWVHQYAAELGADAARIAVMGESAGGGHAAMLTVAARDRGEVPIAFQALVYPMLDDRTGSTPVPPYIGTLIWTPAHNRYGWSALLGVPAGSRRVPKGAVPARVTDLRGLPPTFIGVGSIDLFADEDISYARRLVASGVSTQLEVVPGAFHGFDIMPGTTIGPRFKDTLYTALRTALAVAV